MGTDLSYSYVRVSMTIMDSQKTEDRRQGISSVQEDT